MWNVLVSGVCQRVVVQDDLLPGFERWHSQVRAAGATEGITKVTLAQIKYINIILIIWKQKSTF